MTDERRIIEVEEMLREAGSPMQPPAPFHAAARAAALGEGDVVPIRSRVRPSGRGGRLLLAAAVLTASAAAALVIGVGGNGMQVDRSLSLSGTGTASSASATIDIGSAKSAIRQVRVNVDNLPPAPEGAYYELWMQDGSSDPTGMLAFDTPGSGDVVAHTTMPANMGWTKCWVTLEKPDGSESTVLRLA